jgi:hypothetical protein
VTERAAADKKLPLPMLAQHRYTVHWPNMLQYDSGPLTPLRYLGGSWLTEQLPLLTRRKKTTSMSGLPVS